MISVNQCVVSLFLSTLALGCRDASSSQPVPPAASPTADESEPVAETKTGAASTALVANPLLSRERRVTGWSPQRYADVKNVNDGDHKTTWNAGKPSRDKPAWVAIDVGKGPSRVLVSWSAGGSFNYEETDYGSPGSYRIETSADSSDGEDGAWTAAADVAEVRTHARAHRVDFAGKRWVKLVVTGAPAESPNGVQIDEIEVRDASRGVGDAWFFMGDSITATAFNYAVGTDARFDERIHARHARFFPAVINGGMGGDKSDEGADRISRLLEQNPDARFWAVEYGTNDAAGNSEDTKRFKRNLVTIVERVRDAGRVPILATIPFASDNQHDGIPRYNLVVEDLRASYGLPAGPDLYSWFRAHPDELRDGLHPNERGSASINRLWAEAADKLYPR